MRFFFLYRLFQGTRGVSKVIYYLFISGAGLSMPQALVFGLLLLADTSALP